MIWFRIDKDPCPLGRLLVLIGLPDESYHFDSCECCNHYKTQDYITLCELLEEKGYKFGESYYSGDGKWGWLFLGKEEEIL